MWGLPMFFNITQSRKKGLFSISLEQVPARFCTLLLFGDVMRTHAHPQTLILLFTLPKQPLWHMLSVLHLMEFKRSSQRVGPTAMDQWKATQLLCWTRTRNMYLTANHKTPQTQLGHLQSEKSLQSRELILKTKSHLLGWDWERNSIFLCFLAHLTLWRWHS